MRSPYGHPQPGAIVADETALAAIAATDRHNGMEKLLESGRLYRFVAGSIAAAAADSVVEPDAGTGRWHRIAESQDLGTAAALDVGTVAGTVAAGDDARLSDTRAPSDGSVTSAKLAPSAAGEAVPFVLRKAIAAGATGAADDVAIIAEADGNMRIVDVQFRVTGGNDTNRTATLYDAIGGAGGAGNALSDAFDCATTGRKEQAGASATIADGDALYLNRSHDAIAGELILTLVREPE